MFFKRVITLAFVLTTCVLSNAQRYRNYAMATDTKKMRMERIIQLPSADVYDEWENKFCHAKTEYIPNTYKFDLRHFSMPIKQDIITSNFGRRWNRNHNGVDIKAYLGDTIYAAFDGRVRVVKYDASGYGKVIVVRHYNGLETVYGHLCSQLVKVNDEVMAGHPIGLAGNTGRSTGTHLHFETRFCGIPINPLEIFSFKYRDVTDDYYVWRKK